jgi:hypothetical protein
MDFRSSNSFAALALLIASGGCALFAPSAHAGERLEFSKPAIPLAVPKPDVETKETKKMLSSAPLDPGLYSGMEAGLPEEIIVIKSKSRDKYEWDSESRLVDPLADKDPLLSIDGDKRDADDWLTERPESGRATNNSRLKMPRGWDARGSDGSFRRTNDSRFHASLHAGQNNSIFGSEIGFGAENSRDGIGDGRDGLHDEREVNHDVRDGNPGSRDNDRDKQDGNADEKQGTQITWDGDRPGQEASKEKNGLFSPMKFSRDSSGTDRFNAARFMPFAGESGDLGGISGHETQMIMPGQAANSPHMADMPPAFPRDNWTSTPFGDSQNRQNNELFGAQPGGEGQGLRAWEQPAPSILQPRSSFSPGQNSPARMDVPNRPVNLPFPKRPGDPF